MRQATGRPRTATGRRRTATGGPKSAVHSNTRLTGTPGGSSGGGLRVVRCDQKMNKETVSQKTGQSQGGKSGGRNLAKTRSGSRAVGQEGRRKKLKAFSSRHNYQCVVPKGLREWYHRQRVRRQEVKRKPVPTSPASSCQTASGGSTHTALSPEGCPECVLVSQSLGEGSVEKHTWSLPSHSSWDDSLPEDILTRALAEMM